MTTVAVHRTTNFTRCARCGAVAPRVLGHSAAKIADGAQAGRLLLRAATSCSGHILTCHEDMPSQNVSVKSTLDAIDE